MKKRSAWFAAWFAVLIIGVVAMMAVAPMGKAAEQKQFIVGFDAEFPPYGYMDDNGEYVGFDLDLGRGLQEKWLEISKTPDCLGFQGFGTCDRRDFVYLEWIYDEWT